MKNKLKVFSLLLCIATFSMFCSCSKESQLVGKWKLVEESYDGVNWYESMFAGATFEFNSDGTYEAMGFVGTYSVDGDYLIMDGERIEIIKLTNSELIFFYEGDEDTNGYYEKYVKL